MVKKMYFTNLKCSYVHELYFANISQKPEPKIPTKQVHNSLCTTTYNFLDFPLDKPSVLGGDLIKLCLKTYELCIYWPFASTLLTNFLALLYDTEEFYLP